MAAIIDHFLKCNENLKMILLQQNVITESKTTLGFPYMLNMGLCYPEAWQNKEDAFWPVNFPTDDELHWSSAHSSNEDPAYCISKLLPHLEFTYESFYEDVWDGKFSLQDGVFRELISAETPAEE